MRLLTIVLTLVLFSGPSISADEIVLKDGSTIEGQITMVTGTKVIVKHANGTLTLDRSEVASLAESDSVAPTPSRSIPSPSSANPELGPEFWPPVLNKKYPDLTLYNQHGKAVTLSKIARGRIILLEPIGMPCKACQAFSGGHRYGSYGGVTPQSNLESVEQFFPKYAGGEEIANPKIVFVQLILYDMNMKAPSAEAVRDWAKHFNLAHKPNTYVLAGTPEMVGQASFEMIPGFQLIDKNFIFRADSTGHRPKHNLWRELLPSIPRAFNQPR